MSLYLKYRPYDFTNLVGQSFVKDTLQKAIENNKTVGAYLFCGPRGTGKTSTARIFAKTVNCKDINKGNPCLKCDICKDFLDEKLIDIIEIDAASVTGVDNIRDIIEKSQFQPTKTKYKVYIIDEVHMLSKGAFNALLKILEEPPYHVKFILATTETHKVPETIISRCQRYDFKRISDDDIRNRLGFIADSENIKTDSKSINYIIKNSSGGLRNAISLFEQLIFDSEINYEIIVKKLEIVDENIIASFLEKLINGDHSVIKILDKNISDGKNIKLFFKELLFYTKNKALEELKSNNNISKYVNILEILDDTYSKTKNSLDENITFTIGILKILNPPILNYYPLREKEDVKKIENKKYSSSPLKKGIIGELGKKTTKDSEISYEDIGNIFLDEPQIEKKEETISNFDNNQFINKLKKNGAKGGLTMALRGSLLNLQGEELIIGCKTKISKGQVENVDNISIMIKSLTDMGFNNPKIKIN